MGGQHRPLLPPEAIQGPFLYQTLLPSFRLRTDDLEEDQHRGSYPVPQNIRRVTLYPDSMFTFGACYCTTELGTINWWGFPREGDGEVPHGHELPNDRSDRTWRTRERDELCKTVTCTTRIYKDRSIRRPPNSPLLTRASSLIEGLCSRVLSIVSSRDTQVNERHAGHQRLELQVTDISPR